MTSAALPMQANFSRHNHLDLTAVSGGSCESALTPTPDNSERNVRARQR
jgi:hypothetical protein